jgi:hypothetical protein
MSKRMWNREAASHRTALHPGAGRFIIVLSVAVDS